MTMAMLLVMTVAMMLVITVAMMLVMLMAAHISADIHQPAGKVCMCWDPEGAGSGSGYEEETNCRLPFVG